MATKKKVKKVEKVEEVKEEQEVKEPIVKPKTDSKLIKVVALSGYKRLGIKDSQLGYIPEEGEEFEITHDRFNQLTNNKWNEPLVKVK